MTDKTVDASDPAHVGICSSRDVAANLQRIQRGALSLLQFAEWMLHSSNHQPDSNKAAGTSTSTNQPTVLEAGPVFAQTTAPFYDVGHAKVDRDQHIVQKDTNLAPMPPNKDLFCPNNDVSESLYSDEILLYESNDQDSKLSPSLSPPDHKKGTSTSSYIVSPEARESPPQDRDSTMNPRKKRERSTTQEEPFTASIVDVDEDDDDDNDIEIIENISATGSKRQKMADPPSYVHFVDWIDVDDEEAVHEEPTFVAKNDRVRPLRRSVGHTRKVLNTFLGTLGLTSSFGVPVVSSTGGKVSHITLNEDLNDFPTHEQDTLRWWLRDGSGRLRLAKVFDPALAQQQDPPLPQQDPQGLPVFCARKQAKSGGAICSYVGHFRCTKFIRRNEAPEKFKPNLQALLEFQFVRFDNNLCKTLSQIPSSSSCL